MSERPNVGDEVVYRIWDPAEQEWSTEFGLCAVVTGPPTDPIPKIHITYVNGSGQTVRVNNVDNEEFFVTGALARGNDYWVIRRVPFIDNDGEYPDETFRPAVGSPIWYRVWNGSDYDTVAGVVRTVLGNPNDQHPRIHLTWVAGDGSDENENNVDSLEDAGANATHWVNRLDAPGDYTTKSRP